jgi:hypothetical protein
MLELAMNDTSNMKKIPIILLHSGTLRKKLNTVSVYQDRERETKDG